MVPVPLVVRLRMASKSSGAPDRRVNVRKPPHTSLSGAVVHTPCRSTAWAAVKAGTQFCRFAATRDGVRRRQTWADETTEKRRHE